MSDTVKLVIEIPKKIYEHACDGVNKFVTMEMDVVIENAVKNGTPLSEVLSEIRGEIVDLAKQTMNDTRAGGVYMALNIVDKHVANSYISREGDK